MSEDKKTKKSQKRVDRQKRRAERQRTRAEIEADKKASIKYKPIRVRLSKKSLPGFLAKNADAIIQWLKDYQLLYIAADDYGFHNLERFPEARLKHVMQNYVDLVDFISMLEMIKYESENQISSELSSNSDDIENNNISCIF